MELEGREIGHYRVLSLIGHGAMGYVYLAEDPRILQQVAIKVLQNDPSSHTDGKTSDNLALFRDEARLIAQLKHPRIVHLNYYDEATIDGNSIIYLVTPFYKDGSLAKWLDERGSKELSLEDITHLISQAADALQYAHNYHIVHRDVKPSNFLIDTEGITNPNRPNLLLTDFGIATFKSSTTASVAQAYSGGLTYIAPEQLIGQSIYASDQYALAIMAYELLTGHPPFQGTPQVLMRQHTNTPPDPPSTEKPTIPKAIDTVILRALAKKPEDRFGSIEAFATAFQRGSGLINQARANVKPPNDQAGPDVKPPNGQAGSDVNLPRGKDISATVVISPSEAQYGTNKVLTLGSRRVPILVAPKAYNGLVLHLEGQGEPSPAGGLPGTLHVKISVTPYQTPPPPQMPPPYQQPRPPYQAPKPPYQAPPQPMQPPFVVAQKKPNRGTWFVLGILGGILLVVLFFICAISLLFSGVH